MYEAKNSNIFRLLDILACNSANLWSKYDIRMEACNRFTSIHATAYGAVLHNKCREYLDFVYFTVVRQCIQNYVIGITTSSYWYFLTRIRIRVAAAHAEICQDYI